LKTLLIPNKALWWVTGGAAVFLAFVLVNPFLRNLFKFATLNCWGTVLIVLSGVASVLIAESVKITGIRTFIHGGKNEE
jgi:Ca2+-transporting ATPase